MADEPKRPERLSDLTPDAVVDLIADLNSASRSLARSMRRTGADPSINRIATLCGVAVELIGSFRTIHLALTRSEYSFVSTTLERIVQFVSGEGPALDFARKLADARSAPSDLPRLSLVELQASVDQQATELFSAIEAAKDLIDRKKASIAVQSRVGIADVEERLQRLAEREQQIDQALHDAAAVRSQVNELSLKVQSMMVAIMERSESAATELSKAQDWFKANSQLVADAIAGTQNLDVIRAFEERAEAHRGKEIEARDRFKWSLGGIVLAGMHLVSIDLSAAATLGTVTAFVLKNTLFFGLTTALTRIFLKQWNLERNLRLIYEHRVAALKQYILFDKSILDGDQAAKDRLRMAVAQMIFSDPQTGYLQESGGELSISPIVNVGEQLAKKQGG